MRIDFESGATSWQTLPSAVLVGILFSSLVLVVACDGGSGKPAPAGDVIATVNAEPITPGDLQARMSGRASREERLENAISTVLVEQEARRRGLDALPEIREALDRVAERARREQAEILRRALFEATGAESKISEEELLAHYQETKSRYQERQFHFLQERFATRDEANAKNDALGEKGRLDPATAEEVGPAASNNLPRELVPRVLRLRRPGDRVVVGQGDDWRLVELLELLPSEPRAFKDVRTDVERSLRILKAQASFEALLARLREEAKVTIDQAALAEVPDAPQTPPRPHAGGPS